MPPEGFRWMTAEEWDASDNLWLMLHNAEQRTGDQRKMSLFGAGCCRRHWSFLLPESRAILAEFEALLDTPPRATSGDIFTACLTLCRRANVAVESVRPLDPSTDELRVAAAKAVCYAVTGSWGAYGYFTELDPSEKVPFVHLLRDIFGNPFRPAAIQAAWRTGPATSLARGMYDSGDYSPMPILADVLEESGCDSGEVLRHCRSSGQHFRGCWVLDSLLGIKAEPVNGLESQGRRESP
jgi:hypothetical protein